MAENSSIRCMQLPLLDMHLLLPNSAVAEIIGYTEPEAGSEGSDWYDGKISWRGVMVPIVSVEKMCQSNSVGAGSRSRIAIVYNLDGDDAMPYFGIILQDIPRAYLAEEERLLESGLEVDCEYLSTQADAMIDRLYIPDLDAILASLKQKIQQ
jgi:chemosensory pili system protein ChpC